MSEAEVSTTATAAEEVVSEALGLVRETILSNPTMAYPLLEAAFGRSPATDVATDAKMKATVAEAMKLAAIMVGINTLEARDDKVDGLEADLMAAVQVSYNHGAEDWALLNYPSWRERLEAGKKLYLEGKTG